MLVTATGTSIGGVYLIRKRISGRKDEGANSGADAKASVGVGPSAESTGNGAPAEDSVTPSVPDSPSSA